MEGKKICYFHKFNFCKKGRDCKYFHHSEVCEEKCDIKVCLKRHLQTSHCMFFTMYGKCKNDKSCKFLHETSEPGQDVNNEEIQSLKTKVKLLEDEIRSINFKNKQINDVLKERIINLEASVKSLLHNDMVRSEEEEMLEEQDDSINKNDDGSFMTEESSYYICDDLEFKEILEDELCVISNIKTNISDINENLKPRKIDETLSKLQILKVNVQNDIVRMKNVERHPENESYSEEFYKMIDNFMKMTERLGNVSKNKFRKVAEDELKEFSKDINIVQSNKQGNRYAMFDN